MLVSIQVAPAFRYRLRFPRPGDGLIRIPHDAFHYQCDFKWPRLAPLEGYIAEWRLDTINGVEVSVPEGAKLNGPLFLRIRTESNDRGEVTKAYYGRVGWPANTSDAHGGGMIVARNPRNYPNGGLIFVYSLNLSGTRTMDMRPADAAGSR